MEERQLFNQKEVIRNELDQFENDPDGSQFQTKEAEEESRIKSVEQPDQDSSLSFVDIDEAVMGVKEL